MKNYVAPPNLSLRWAWAALAFWIWVLMCLAAFAVDACEPDTITMTPTPMLAWSYDESQQNGLLGYAVYVRDATGLQLARCFEDCWIYTDEDTGLSSRQYCRGTDLQVPVQRCLDGHENENVGYYVRAVDRWGIESVVPSNEVWICMPAIWRGGPYR